MHFLDISIMSSAYVVKDKSGLALLFHDEGSYQIETSPLIYRTNQWTGFNMIGTSVIKELRKPFAVNNYFKYFPCSWKLCQPRQSLFF